MNLNSIEKSGDLYKVMKNYDEDKSDNILLNLRENEYQVVKYAGKDYFFIEFHYDGVLLMSFIDEKLVYIGKWWIQNITIV